MNSKIILTICFLVFAIGIATSIAISIKTQRNLAETNARFDRELFEISNRIQYLAGQEQRNYAHNVEANENISKKVDSSAIERQCKSIEEKTNQLQALLKEHVENNDKRFFTIDDKLSKLQNPPPVKNPIIKKSVSWPSSTGKDKHGLWADLTLEGVTQRFRWIDPGSFVMGSSQSEKDEVNKVAAGWFKDEQEHHVVLTKGFWIADTSCTQKLWKEITDSNPSLFTDDPMNPVEQISWDDCQDFLKIMNERVTGCKMRLSTEAEWEFACRSGTKTAFSFGVTATTNEVNYNGKNPFGGAEKGSYREKPIPVKSLPENDLGLFEMHGNVSNWCSDWYGAYPNDIVTDPIGPNSGKFHVYRGGDWSGGAIVCRSAARAYDKPDRKTCGVGMRIVVEGK